MDLENKVSQAQSQIMTHAVYHELWKGADESAQYVLGLDLHTRNLMMVDTIKEVQRRTQVFAERLPKSGDLELIILVAPLEQSIGQQGFGYLALPAKLVLVVLLIWYICVEICVA